MRLSPCCGCFPRGTCAGTSEQDQAVRRGTPQKEDKQGASSRLPTKWSTCFVGIDGRQQRDGTVGPQPICRHCSAAHGINEQCLECKGITHARRIAYSEQTNNWGRYTPRRQLCHRFYKLEPCAKTVKIILSVPSISTLVLGCTSGLPMHFPTNCPVADWPRLALNLTIRFFFQILG